MSRNDWGYRVNGPGDFGYGGRERPRYGEFDEWSRGAPGGSRQPGGRPGGQRRRGQELYDRGGRGPDDRFSSAADDRYTRHDGRSGWQDDDEVRSAVRQALFEDGWLDASRIEVQVKDRVVTLSGQVAGHLDARYAWDDAWDAPGVEGVINRLEVLEPPAADAAG